MLTETSHPSTSQMKMDNTHNSSTKTDSKKTDSTPAGTGFAKTAVVYQADGSSKQVELSDIKFNQGERVYFAGNALTIGQDADRDSAMKQLVKIAETGKMGKTDAIIQVNKDLPSGKKFKVFSNPPSNQSKPSPRK